MTLVRDTAVHNMDLKLLQRMLGRPTREQVNKMCGVIAAVYAEAKTSHKSFPPWIKIRILRSHLKEGQVYCPPQHDSNCSLI